MADFAQLLAKHRPVLRYDSHEIYFADSAAEWTDNTANVLRDAGGALVAAAAPQEGETQLSLDLLCQATYPNGSAPSKDDRIGDTTKDYVEQARQLHLNSKYRNQMYGRWAKSEADGCWWLQYWFFYFYNDYNLAGEIGGEIGSAGLHEGDWEMIQLQLDANNEPQLAVYSQHKHAGQRAWSKVEKDGDRAIVYPARGSHANYFGRSKLIPFWTGVWFDHADGKGWSPDIALNVVEDSDPGYAWLLKWPGYWGDTLPSGIPFDATSPSAPCRHDAWSEPHDLIEKTNELRAQAKEAPPPAVPPPPRAVVLTRKDGTLHVSYDSRAWPTGSEPAALVITVNSHEDPLPPTTRKVEIDSTSGDVDTGIEARDNWSYDAAVSFVDTNGVASASRPVGLPAASGRP
jgi:hypothetical protein